MTRRSFTRAQRTSRRLSRSASARQRSLRLEWLEPRELLAVDALSIVSGRELLRDHTLPALARVAPEVSEALAALQARQAVAANFAGREQFELSDLGIVDLAPARFQPDGDVLVSIDFRPGNASFRARLESLGVSVYADATERGQIDAWVSSGELALLSRLASVNYVALPQSAIAATGPFNSEGDAVSRANLVRSRFANFGVGQSTIQIGVISDGVTHLQDAINAGEINWTVSVEPGFAGSGDEGTAMLEIVYDLFPGASLYFSSGIASPTRFEDAVEWMVGQGVDVIVDDLVFFRSEPYFTDGPVAQAVASAITSGVTYVTSAGNANVSNTTGFQHYQSQSRINAGTLRHDFDPTAGFDDALDIQVPPQSQLEVRLQWSDAWGASGSNYNLFLRNSANTATLASSTTVQDGNDMPTETLFFFNSALTTQSYKLWITTATGGVPSRELEMFLFNGLIQQPTYAQTTAVDALIGQQAVEGAIVVGAVNFDSSTLAPYSSRGPSTIYTNFASQTKVQRNTLDIASTDKVTTMASVNRWAPFQNNTDNYFRGTSAAAPHVAAAVGLMRHLTFNSTTFNYAGALATAAIDAGTAGYDQLYGWGRLDALKSAYLAFRPPMPDLPTASDNGVSSVDNLTSMTNFPITGIAPADSFVEFYRNGVLFAQQQLTGGATSYSFNPGQGTETVWDYWVRMKEVSSDPAALFSPTSDALTVVVDPWGNTVPGQPDMLASSDSGVSSSDNITTNTQPTFTGSMIDATGGFVVFILDGVIQTSQFIPSPQNTYFYTTPVLTPGWHTFSVKQKKLGGGAERYFESPQLVFYVDNGGAPTVTLTPVSPDPRNFPVGSIQIAFNRPVAGFALNDLTMTKDGGANRLPGTATFNVSQSTYTLSHIADITMASGNYSLTVDLTGVVSAATGLPLGVSSLNDTWTQTNATYQNPLRYYDINDDTFVSPSDALTLINLLNAGYGGPLPGSISPLNPPYVDPSGDNFLAPNDALAVINFLNGGYTGGPYLMAVTPGGPSVAANPDEAEIAIRLEVVSADGKPLSSISEGSSFVLRGYADVTNEAAAGVFAAFADVLFDRRLVRPVTGDRSGTLDDVGGVLGVDAWEASGRPFFEQKFKAVRSGNLLFRSESADEYGNDILVFGGNEAVPVDQTTFGSVGLTIVARSSSAVAAMALADSVQPASEGQVAEPAADGLDLNQPAINNRHDLALTLAPLTSSVPALALPELDTLFESLSSQPDDVDWLAEESE